MIQGHYDGQSSCRPAKAIRVYGGRVRDPAAGAATAPAEEEQPTPGDLPELRAGLLDESGDRLLYGL